MRRANRGDNPMDSNSADKVPNSIRHHHHHHHGGHRHQHHHIFYISPHCPLHHPILQPKNHSPSCSFSNYCAAPQNPQPLASQTLHHHSLMMQDGIEKVEDEEEDEEGEAIFVLTDEWKEFFAKSEAKRRLAKKQAKKGKN